MKIKRYSRMIFILSIFILSTILISSVSASDDFNVNDGDFQDILDNASSYSSNQKNVHIITEDNASSYSSNQKNVHIITEDNYYNYFKDNGFIDVNNYSEYNSSNLINSNVKEGDTIDLSGKFTNKSFIFKIPLTITSSNKNAYLYDCQIAFIYKNVSSDVETQISNLNIENDVEGKTAILTMVFDNVRINNNNIYSTGGSAYPIFLKTTTDSNVVFNRVKTSMGKGGAWQHPGILLADSHYNFIGSNDVVVEDSNGIYLSQYSGGFSNYNVIFNNTVRSSLPNPSSWCYGIQMMGDYNSALNNTVYNSYRGISAYGEYNEVIGNVIFNITGSYYEGSSNLDGGDYVITASVNAIVANNTIYDSIVSSAAIYLSKCSTCYGNSIKIINDKTGIEIGGSDCLIYNNSVSILSGYGIHAMGNMSDILIENNIINSLKTTDSQLGSGSSLIILIEYQTKRFPPSNIVIRNNDLFTSNKVAIDISNCDYWNYTCIDNNVHGKDIILPEFRNSTTNKTIISSKIYYINEKNYGNYFNIKGNLKPKVLDGDTLIFNGSFLNKGQMILSKSVKIIGKKAKFINTTIIVNADNCQIINITIANANYYKSNLWGIKVLGDNVSIIGNNIYVNDKNTSYGVYILDSFKGNISYNNINVIGSRLTNGIIGFEVSDYSIESNNIFVIGTGKIHKYEGSVCIDDKHSVGEMSKTYGLVMIYSDNNYVHLNNIKVTSSIKKDLQEFNQSTNTLIGIDFYYGSDNNLIDSNIVNVVAKDPFIYGLGVVGAVIDANSPGSINNSFNNNYIFLNGSYFASGIIEGNQAIDTTLFNNTIILYSNTFTYGITLEMSKSSIINSNKILGYGKNNYGIEIYSSDGNKVYFNDVYGGGEYAENVGIFNSKNNIIIKNNLTSNGTVSPNVLSPQNPYHPDSVPLINTPIWVDPDSKDHNDISNNTMTSPYNPPFSDPIKSSKKGDFGNFPSNSIKKGNFGNSGSINSNSITNGSYYNGGSLDLDNSNGLSDMGDLEGDSSSSGDVSSGNTYEMDSASSKSMNSTFAIPLIVLLLISLFCYGFLRNEEK